MNKTTNFSEKALSIIFQVSWGRKLCLKYWKGQRTISNLQDILCKTRPLRPQFEEIMESKKLSSMLFWSLNCFKISLGIFASNHHTLKLLKQKKHTRYFWSVCANNMSEFPGIPCIYTALAGAGRFSLGRKFYFNFPSRCCHYGEIIIIWPVLLRRLFYLFLPTQSR